MKTKDVKKISATKILGVSLTLLFSLTTLPAYSNGVGLNATRIVYIQDENSASIGARNKTDINYLAKFSVSQKADGTGPAPFTVTPPLIKIDAGKSQDIRVFAQQNSLPRDRESVFYFSGIMIPATNGPADRTALNIGYNNVIKLFYRPSHLKVSPQEAYSQLIIKSTSTGVVVENNSPYYISLNELKINGVKVELSLKKNNTMVSPFNSFSYIVPANGRKGIATWTVINDLGGEDVYSGQVN
ncbi:Chaperone protein focC precursor [Providencia rustigianii]|nr:MULTISPECIES: molecular chaperone [Providencia]SPY76343.1 Chaperone protein focC precursor [Providencia rustigianii]SUC25536.1 Chaperone protein focC precursor [Providencia rustigianii]VEB63423.1 Chaperone protein focC precursor [Providencia rustigianii]